MELLIACDGSFARRPGSPDLATYAFVVWENGRLVVCDSGVVCMGAEANSMAAEYGAIVAALYWLERRRPAGGGSVRILSDCRSVLDRLTGRCRVRRWGGCQTLHTAAMQSAARLTQAGCILTLECTHRLEVAAAHDLCNTICRLEQSGFTTSPSLRPIAAFLSARAATLRTRTEFD